MTKIKQYCIIGVTSKSRSSLKFERVKNLANCKQLLPVYDKPMIYYPLSTLMLAGIRDILIITTPEDNYRFKELLGNGSSFGVKITYAIQEKPNGLAEAFIIGEDFIDGDDVALVLGDNVFHGQGFTDKLKSARNKIERKKANAVIFGYQVKDPKRFGVIGFDEEMDVKSLEEKPDFPESNYAATGLYFYNNSVVEIAKQVQPSPRGELEITDVNKAFLKGGHLSVELLGRGFAWLDTGTHESLLQASQYIETVQRLQNVQVANLEEIAYRKGWISKEQVEELAQPLCKNDYGNYLLRIINS